MAVDSPNALSRHLRHTAGLAEAEPTDGQLLARFADEREEAAFTELVRRHGPMVLGVCRRIAGNVHDADDAFQATFLILARKARSLAGTPVLGGWLYGVAYRCALKAKAVAARRRAKEATAARPEGVEAMAEQTDVLAVIEQELGRLPKRYREPLVTISPPFGARAMSVTPRSTSSRVRVFTGMSSTPYNGATAWMAAN